MAAHPDAQGAAAALDLGLLREELLGEARDHARVLAVAHDAEGLPAPRLPVREEAPVVPRGEAGCPQYYKKSPTY